MNDTKLLTANGTLIHRSDATHRVRCFKLLMQNENMLYCRLTCIGILFKMDYKSSKKIFDTQREFILMLILLSRRVIFK